MASPLAGRSAVAPVPLPAEASAGPQRPTLARRLLLTLLLLAAARLTSWIPLPGIDPVGIIRVTGQHWGSILDVGSMGGMLTWARLSIGALGVTPYISAWIIVQFIAAFLPSARTVRATGGAGRNRIDVYIRYTTLGFALFQGFAVASAIERIGGGGLPVVNEPGPFFLLVATLSLAGSSLFLVWLGEQISEFGIGYGVPLIIASGILVGLPRGIVNIVDLWRHEMYWQNGIVILLAAVAATTFAALFIERARYFIQIQSPRWQEAGSTIEGETTRYELGLNPAGIIPLLCLLVSGTVLSPNANSKFGGWALWFSSWVEHHGPIYLALNIGLFMLTAIVLGRTAVDPMASAARLQQRGLFILGIRPGQDTADYVGRVSTRLSLPGGTALCALALLPGLVMAGLDLPGYPSGISLLIVVITAMAIRTRLQSLAQE